MLRYMIGESCISRKFKGFRVGVGGSVCICVFFGIFYLKMGINYVFFNGVGYSSRWWCENKIGIKDIRVLLLINLWISYLI